MVPRWSQRISGGWPLGPTVLPWVRWANMLRSFLDKKAVNLGRVPLEASGIPSVEAGNGPSGCRWRHGMPKRSSNLQMGCPARHTLAGRAAITCWP